MEEARNIRQENFSISLMHAYGSLTNTNTFINMICFYIRRFMIQIKTTFTLIELELQLLKFLKVSHNP